MESPTIVRKRLQCDDKKPKIAVLRCKEADYFLCESHLEDPDFQEGIRLE